MLWIMPEPGTDHYREKAERCRLMLPIAAKPEIKEQLRLCEIEFNDIAADKIERRNRQPRSIGERAGPRPLSVSIGRIVLGSALGEGLTLSLLGCGQ